MKVYKFYWNFDDEIPTFEFTITKDVNYFFDNDDIYVETRNRIYKLVATD